MSIVPGTFAANQSLRPSIIAAALMAVLCFMPVRADAQCVGSPACGGMVCSFYYHVQIPNSQIIGFKVEARQARCGIPGVAFYVTATGSTMSACGAVGSGTRATVNALVSSTAVGRGTGLMVTSPECRIKVFNNPTCVGTTLATCTVNQLDGLPVELLSFGVD